KLYQKEAEQKIASANAKGEEAIRDTAKAHQRVEELRKQNLELERQLQPRFTTFDKEKFRNELKGKPKTRVDVIYPKDDGESYDLANLIAGLLKSEGWTVLGPRPLLEDDVDPNVADKTAPLIVRAGVGWGGIAFIVKTLAEPDMTNSPTTVLMNAITS